MCTLYVIRSRCHTLIQSVASGNAKTAVTHHPVHIYIYAYKFMNTYMHPYMYIHCMSYEVDATLLLRVWVICHGSLGISWRHTLKNSVASTTYDIQCTHVSTLQCTLCINIVCCIDYVLLFRVWHQEMPRLQWHMGWLRWVGSLKLQVTFAKYRLFYRALLQKRLIILRSLLIVATPCQTHS